MHIAVFLFSAQSFVFVAFCYKVYVAVESTSARATFNVTVFLDTFNESVVPVAVPRTATATTAVYTPVMTL